MRIDPPLAGTIRPSKQYLQSQQWSWWCLFCLWTKGNEEPQEQDSRLSGTHSATCHSIWNPWRDDWQQHFNQYTFSWKGASWPTTNTMASIIFIKGSFFASIVLWTKSYFMPRNPLHFSTKFSSLTVLFFLSLNFQWAPAEITINYRKPSESLDIFGEMPKACYSHSEFSYSKLIGRTVFWRHTRTHSHIPIRL